MYPDARRYVAALALALLFSEPSPSDADDLHPRASAGAAVYSESMHTSIVSTHASAGARLPGQLEADVAWSADIISSASVDVITAATDRIEEQRHQVGVTLGRESLLTDLDVVAGYAFSLERDSYAHIGQVKVRQSLFEDNLELSFGYGLSYNRLGMRGEPKGRWRALWVHTLDVGLTYLLDSRTRVELIYSGGLSRGFQGSRYRRVPITFRQDLRDTAWVDEVHPHDRWRHAATLRGVRAVGDRWTVSAGYRFYRDSWRVTGHTLTLETSVALPGHLTLTARARGSQQGAASFYQSIYTAPTQYRTRDRRLSAHRAGMVGLAATWDMTSYTELDALELRASADGVLYRFDHYVMPRLDDFGGADWSTLGDIRGLVVQLQLRIRL